MRLESYPSYGELLERMHRKCVECSGSKSQAQKCRLDACPLWPVPGLQAKRATRGERRRAGQQLRMVFRGETVVRMD